MRIASPLQVFRRPHSNQTLNDRPSGDYWPLD